MQGDWVFGKRDTRHREDVETQGEDQEKAGLEWGICRPREAGGPQELWRGSEQTLRGTARGSAALSAP